MPLLSYVSHFRSDSALFLLLLFLLLLLVLVLVLVLALLFLLFLLLSLYHAFPYLLKPSLPPTFLHPFTERETERRKGKREERRYLGREEASLGKENKQSKEGGHLRILEGNVDEGKGKNEEKEGRKRRDGENVYVFIARFMVLDVSK